MSQMSGRLDGMEDAVIKKRKEDIFPILICFSIAFIALFCAYSRFLNISLTSDMIGCYVFGTNPPTISDFPAFLAGGRIGAFIVYLLWDYPLQMVLELQPLTHFLTIVLFAAGATCVVFLYNRQVFQLKGKNLYILMLLLSFCFINPFIVQLFIYPGTTWGIGILLAVFAAWRFLDKKYVSSFFVLLCSISIYQSYYAIFLILTLSIIYMRNQGKLNPYSFRQSAGAIFMVGGAAGTLLLMTKAPTWFDRSLAQYQAKPIGLGASGNIAEKLWEIWVHILGLLHNFHGQMPKSFVAIMTVILVVVCCIVLKKRGEKIYNLLYLCAVIGFCYVCVFIFMLITSIYYPPRIVFVVFWAFSIVFVLAYSILQTRNQKIFLLCLALVSLLVTWFYLQTSITDFFIANSLDKEYVTSVQTEIENYEKESSQTISKVAVSSNKPRTPIESKYLHLNYTNSTYCNRIVYDSWADVEFLNFVNHTKYQKVEMSSSVYQKYFATSNAKEFNAKEQLVFDGDTLYWMIY
ncbi:MAG: glucosyltransferase domain-containing protein [Ruthenibacterium sp.]